MKLRFPAFVPFVILAVFLLAPVLVRAQAAATRTPSPVAPRYDVRQEVRLEGTVTSVVKRPTAEMRMEMGSHFLVSTSAGTVDASLGRFALVGKGAMEVTSGQHVQLTGVMKTENGKQVFITRAVITSGHTYVLRNEHGFPYEPAARRGHATPVPAGALGGERKTASTTETKGGSL
jgi:hypothetical protein